MLPLLLAALAQDGSDPVAPAERAPNIVLVLADDLGIGDLGCYNPASKIPTPHMDRIAEQGLRLVDCHSPSAVCTPTRYGVLTGRYAWRTRLESGVLWGSSTNLIDPERLTIADALRSAGYSTGCIGKWHLGLGDGERTDWAAPLRPGPLDHGFDTFFGIPASLDMEPYLYVLDDRPVQPADHEVAGSAHRRQGGGGFWRAGPVARDFRHVEVLPRLVQRSVEFIERATREEPQRPFFLYLPLSAPHTPWLPTERFAGTTEIAHYGDFVAQVDGAVGTLLAALERLGIDEDTVVLVTSDNGSHWPDDEIDRHGHDANLGYRGQKADIFEGGHRVPFVVRWPGRIPAGAVRGDLFSLTDLFATCLGLIGVDLPAEGGEDSFDQSSVLLGSEPGATVRSDLVHHAMDGMFAIRRGRWKLIEGLGSGGFTGPRRIEPQPGGPTGQLYDLESDPAERVDLWSERPEVVAELRALLAEQRTAGRTRPAD